MKIHEKYINRCIELAKNGMGTTYPNPLVGSVVVWNDIIIGEGWHMKAGEAHAEVHAINAVKDKSLLKEATIYVNLEPCSHHGKTPPCTHLIVKSGIKSVVIGGIDSHSKVNGQGIAHLKKKGCKVTVGVMELECKELNKRFFTFHNKKRPYIILKWAETKDGYIDRERDKNSENKPYWISNLYARQIAHKMRAEEHAILIGTTTALNDNPSLTCRSWYGAHPMRIVIDQKLKIPSNYHLLDGNVKTIVITENEDVGSTDKKVVFAEIDFSHCVLEQTCKIMYNLDIQSVIIEGGAYTLQYFIDEDMWDEAHIFIGNKTFGSGLSAPKLQYQLEETIKLSGDTLNIVKHR